MVLPAHTSRLVKVALFLFFLFLGQVFMTCGEKSVEPQQPPAPGSIVAKFGASVTAGAPPLTVVFTDSSTGSPDFWFWRFGDGGTSFDQHPSHIYDSSGIFAVSLVVSRGEARDSLSKPDYVSVEDSIISAPVAQFSATPLTGDAPLLVQFTNISSGTITSYLWQFGDNTTSTDLAPSHSYAEPGKFTVRLIVTGPGGVDTLERVDYVTAEFPAPVAEFGGSPRSGLVPLEVTFENLSSGTISEYRWYFGDGDSSSVQSPTHTYTLAGKYNVTLIVIGPGGSDTSTMADFIAAADVPPVAAFTGSPTSGVAPLTVIFTNASTGIVTSHRWSFGDGDSSSVINPSHQYTTPGTYSVQLIVAGPGGIDTLLRTNYVTAQYALPVANFTGTPTSGYIPLNVTFTDLSTGTITDHAWTFGDGGNSNEPNPIHQYTAAGSYTVRLIVTGPGGVDTLTRTNYITASIAPPVANFVGAPTSGFVPLTVNFTNQSTGNISGYAWTFGDGGTSSATNPSHTYVTSGTFTVRLITTGPGGVDTLIRQNYISTSIPPPVAAFDASPRSGTEPLTVTFANLSTGVISSYKWNFGDGDSSSATNPVHIYSTAGTYNVTLIASGAGGNDTAFIANFIAVSSGPPIAGFTGAPTSGVAPLTVQFTNSSAGNISSYAWNFGDGVTSTAVSPSHQYVTPGSYSVRLIVTGPGGVDTLLRSNYISVSHPAPVANFVGSPTIGFVPLTVTFTNQSTGTITGYRWNFGDGDTAIVANPSHLYNSAGVFTVRLIVTGPGGTDTLIRTNYITASIAPPVAEFIGSPTSGFVPLTVNFTNQSTGNITGYKWLFGDGDSSFATNPTHQYSSADSYTVRLIATGPGGSDQRVRPNYIVTTIGPPVAGFTASPTSGLAPLAVQFTSTSTGQITSYSWDFGDTFTSSAQNPSHTYLLPGTYTVRLIVAGPAGTDTLIQSNYITANAVPPIAGFTANVTSGNVPLNVQFTDQSSGDITSWSWRFGLVGTSSEQNPSFQFTDSGLYDIRLIVVGPGGTDTLIKAAYINALPPRPVASFSGTPTTGEAPLTVNFSGTSTGNITGYEWNFGDGVTSGVQDPTHIYSTPGVYDVSLKVTGPGGADSTTALAYITVNIPRPVAQFTLSPDSGLAPLDVQFTNTSTGTITGYAWDFGDGASTLLESPFHSYEQPGVYNVRLIVSGPGGTDTLLCVSCVTVVAPPPLAAFEATPISGVAPLNVQFNNLSTGTITTYHWDFGDGDSASVRNPNHTYVTPGLYTVTLREIGPGGEDTLQRVDYISVANPPPTADFTGAPLSGTVPLAVTFSNSSSGAITGYQWDFGDGGSSILENPAYIYSDTGLFTVTLITTGPGGADTLIRIDYIDVNAVAPTADFSADPINGIAPLNVQFTDNSTGAILSYLWNFGDGGSSILASPSHLYPDPGVYSVTLSLLGPSGADTLTKVDYITVLTPPPVAEFTADITSGVAPLSVQFTDLSTGAVTTYEWDFGDATTSTDQSPLHSYSVPGIYTVKLTVTGPGGSNAMTKVDYISVASPRP